MRIVMRILSRLLSKRQASPAAPPVQISERVVGDVGLRDALIRGWFNGDTGELFTNFPVGPEDIVADIGCGNGGNARFCASRGARLILADIDPGSVAEAAARVTAEPNHGGCEAHVTGSDPLPILSESATRVVCTEVIEHVDSAERLMAELARIGRPGALYLLSCPDSRSEEIQKRTAPAVYFVKPNHVRIIQPDEFTRYVEDAGLIVEGRYSDGFFWQMWWNFCWATGGTPDHPVLELWNRTWQCLLDQPNGNSIKHVLDDSLPMRQIIIARKA